MKMMYTPDHIDSSEGSMIHEMFNFLEALENFAQIHKHHLTFYAANFQQYKRSYVTYSPQGRSTQLIELM